MDHLVNFEKKKWTIFWGKWTTFFIREALKDGPFFENGPPQGGSFSKWTNSNVVHFSKWTNSKVVHFFFQHKRWSIFQKWTTLRGKDGPFCTNGPPWDGPFSKMDHLAFFFENTLQDEVIIFSLYRSRRPFRKPIHCCTHFSRNSWDFFLQISQKVVHFEDGPFFYSGVGRIYGRIVKQKIFFSFVLKRNRKKLDVRYTGRKLGILSILSEKP